VDEGLTDHISTGVRRYCDLIYDPRIILWQRCIERSCITADQVSLSTLGESKPGVRHLQRLRPILLSLTTRNKKVPQAPSTRSPVVT
jgi:hypothetical protein